MKEEVEAVELGDNAKITKEAEEMIKKLEEDHKMVLNLKDENALLRSKIDGLVGNNKKLVELLEKLDDRARKTHVEPKGKSIYSYEDGGMVTIDDLGKKRLELHDKKVTLQEINDQLNEILSIMEERGK